MPIIKQKGLRGLSGLRGWSSLSEEEKQTYLAEHPTLKDRSVRDVSNIYDNSQYIKEFGKEDFLAHQDKAWRDARLKHTIVDRTRDELWGDGFLSLSDRENEAIKSQLDGLTDDGFIDLVENSRFVFPTDKSPFDKVLAYQKKVSEEHPTLAMGIGFAESAKGAAYHFIPGFQQRNTNALDSVIARDSERKLATVSDLSSQIYDMFGKMPASQFDEEFSKVFDGQEIKTGYGDNKVDYTVPGIGIYQTFKNQHEMDNFSQEDKKRFLANYYAMAQVYGPAAAQQATTSGLQDYISNNQTAWDWIGSALRGIGGKTIASFGQLALGIQALTNATYKASTEGWDAADKWVANFMEGKDEDGEERIGIDNLAYWNGVDQYGVIPVLDKNSLSKIKEITENGGMSPYNWISDSESPYSIAGATNEMLKMVGYMAAQVALARGVGALGKGAARLTGGAFSEVDGMYNAAWSSPTANIIMKYATPGVTSALNAIPISVGYAKGSYDEVLREATGRADYEAEKWVASQYQPLEERINKGIALTKQGFAVSPDSENPQESAQIANELNNWVVQQFNNRVRQGAKPEEIDVAQLYNNALANYKDYRRNQFLNEYKESPLYKDMIEAARKEAASAYERNATMEFIRMSGVNYLFKQWQQDKSVRAAMNSNYPNLTTVSENGQMAVRGSIFGRTVNPKLARWVQPAKTLWGGFESNYMDDVTAAYAKGFSLGRYNDYVDQLLDPDKNAATVSWMAGFTNALAKAEGMLTDKQAWYDGFIGLGGSGIVVAPGASVWSAATRTGRSNWSTKLNYSETQLAQMASKYGLSIDEYINGEFEEYVQKRNPRYTETQVKEEADRIRREDGFQAAVADGRIERTSVGERINRILYNPILAQYAESAERERNYKAIIDGGNKAIAEKKDAFEDMLRAVYAVNRRNAADKTDSTFEGKEAKAQQAFALVSILSKWMNDPVYSQSEFVQKTWADVQRMAKGENAITQEDIDNFYSSTENRSEVGRPDAEQFAKQRLVSNAQQLVKMKEAYDTALDRVKNSKQFRIIANHNAVDYVVEQLAYNQAMLSNREERKAQLERETGTASNGNYSYVADYGSSTMDSKQNALETLDGEIEELKKVIARQEKYLESRKRRAKGESRSLNSLRRRGTELYIAELNRQLNELTAKKREVSNAEFSDEVLSKDEILQLNHELQAKMFDPANSRLYSKEQLAEIEAAKDELKSRDPDALEKIKDLASLETAIKDTRRSNTIMEDNLEAAADYYEYAGRLRYQRLGDALTNHHYRQVEKAIMEAKDDASKIAYAKTLSSYTLERYLKDHPEDTELLKGVKELTSLADDIRTAIPKAVRSMQDAIDERVNENGTEDTDEDVAMKQDEKALVGSMGTSISETIFGTTDETGRILEPGILYNSSITNEKDMMSAIEDIADRSTDPRVRALYDALLEALEDAQHSRNSTLVQARRARLEAEAKQNEYLRRQDGKNFGWDGYKVGDKVWKNDGTEGEVKGFVEPAEGQTKGAIQILWSGDASITVYTDDSQFTKTEPQDSAAKKATQEAIEAINKCQNADDNIDKLDAIVAFERAVAKGATVTDEAKAIIEKAKKELEDAGVDYRIYLSQPETNAEEEEIIETPQASFTPDGGLITPTPQEQYERALAEDGAQAMEVPDGSAYDAVNTNQEDKNYRTEEGLLEGNGLYEYDVDTLKDLGIVERRSPKNEGGTLSKWFQWLDTNKIQLQEIIDRELNTIISKYPDTKIRFVISNDPLTTNHIIQVIEYDSNVEKIHDDSLGGVITATDGKEKKRYLVVGTTYTHGNWYAYNTIGNPLKEYIKANPKTPFYVHPTMYTKVAKMDAGRLIRQQKGETEIKYRSLSELFNDPSRNPGKISFENAIFGIMYGQQGIVWNRTVSDKVFPPGQSDASLGRLFLAIPAANGNYIPIAIKTSMELNSPDLKQGAFTGTIVDLLRQMTSKNLIERQEAVIELSKYLKFDSEGGKVVNGFLVGTENINNITLVLNGEEVAHWNLDSADFKFNNLQQTVFGTSFKINIEQWMLNPEYTDTLRALDEAGVLRTDVSTLRTANAAYQIYEVGSDGKPVDVKVKRAKPSDRKVGESRRSTSTPPINGVTYRYSQTKKDYVDDKGNQIGDNPELRTSIYYNLLIQSNGLAPSYVSKQTGLSYYIVVNNSDNPTIVSRDETNNNVKVLSKERAQKLLNMLKEEAEIKARREAAAAELERIQKGEEGIKGEEFDEGNEQPGPQRQVPPPQSKTTFIEPKHGDNVAYGPAIRATKLFIKHEGEVNLELHIKTTTNEDGSKLTKVVGWSEKGLEYAIPMSDKYPAYLEIPDEYKIPEDAIPNSDSLYGVTKIQEFPDGTIKAELLYGKNSSYSYGWVTLEKKAAPAKPSTQEQQQAPAQQQEGKKEAPKSDYNPNKALRRPLEGLGKTKKTITFVSMYGKNRVAIDEIAKANGWNWGEDMTTKEKKEFLTSKLQESYPNEKIDLNAINDADNLMEMIRNCKK